MLPDGEIEFNWIFQRDPNFTVRVVSIFEWRQSETPGRKIDV